MPLIHNRYERTGQPALSARDALSSPTGVLVPVPLGGKPQIHFEGFLPQQPITIGKSVRFQQCHLDV
jgi:hypothetical protein